MDPPPYRVRIQTRAAAEIGRHGKGRGRWANAKNYRKHALCGVYYTNR